MANKMVLLITAVIVFGLNAIIGINIFGIINIVLLIYAAVSMKKGGLI